MTLAVTVERFIAVCRPHQYRSISLTMTNTKRLLVYIVPVTVLSFALNIPKFMEVSLTKNNGTNEVCFVRIFSTAQVITVNYMFGTRCLTGGSGSG